MRVVGRFIKAGPVYEVDTKREDADAERLITFSEGSDTSDDALNVVRGEIEAADPDTESVVSIEEDEVIEDDGAEKGGDAK